MEDYSFDNDLFKNIDAMIYTCGYEECAPGHSYGPVIRHGYMVHYILRGQGIYRARGKEFHLKGGDAFLICPGELIYYEADKDDPWDYSWIGMQGIKMKGYLERTSLPAVLVFHYGEDKALQSCHEAMFQTDKLQKNRDLVMNSILYHYLYLLADRFPSAHTAQENKHSDYVEKALLYLEEHYCHPITIQDIADHLGINRSYLHRIFKASTGSSLQSYLLDQRMRHACILLVDTDQSIQAIAHSVGYPDPLNFSKIFRQKVGISPSGYRKDRREKDALLSSPKIPPL